MIQVNNIVQEKISRLKKNSAKKNTGDALFEITTAEDVAQSVEVHASRIAGGSLWMLQEIDGYSEDQKKMKDTGDMLLKELGDIRMGLISGQLGEGNLRNLKNSLEKSNIFLQFPTLQGVIDDIRLRVEVEIAKLESKSE